MINNVTAPNMPQILSIKAQEAYKKLKALIMKIFSLIKNQKNNAEIKEEFYHAYINFARRLKDEGYEKECYAYMSICEMYYRLIDRPNELIAHEEFFTNLFEDFDALLYIKINKPEEFEEKYNEYIANFRKARRYYYTKVAVPSPQYNEDALHEIANNLFKVVE